MSSSAVAAAADEAPPTKKLKTKRSGASTAGVMDYLQLSLPKDSLRELYLDSSRGRFICRAVLQQLPETSQQVVVRLTCCGGQFPKSLVAVWCNSKYWGEKQVEEMVRWAILEPSSSENNNLVLTQEFFQGFKASLHSLDASPWHPLSPAQIQILEQEASAIDGKKASFPAMTPEDLERYTQSQWDAVLHYLVGTPNLDVQPNPAISHFLLETKLMQPDPEYSGDPEDAPLVITRKGYDFMLQDNTQQVWHFVVQYLQSTDRLGNEKAVIFKREALMVLICLSFARFGECYPTSVISKDGRRIVKDLALFGLLYVKKIGKKSIFYPTRIAMQLVGGVEGSSSSSSRGSKRGGGGGMWSLSSKALDSALAHPYPSDSSHLAIIVQTNFQLCAYTTSELHVSMLGLFCEVQTIRRLPNVVFMSITRDSIKAAFALGIQAQQILRFLEKHAHPKLRTGSATPIPSNVVDQIFLWDRERHRVLWNEVFMHQCLLDGEFQAVQKFTLDLQAHTWSNEGRNQLFIKYAFAEQVQSFVRQWRAKTAAG
jgi:transcription initiation factor TFIIH subunit 4